jgi:queuine tRNA-ribosyltransferase accessory subunit
MDNLKSRGASELPAEMMSFMLAQFDANRLGPRLGRLLRHGRMPLQTPHYVPTTSRGVVPHISHDVLQSHTAIRGVYIALEDCSLLPSFTRSLR